MIQKAVISETVLHTLTMFTLLVLIGEEMIFSEVKLIILF